MTKILKAYVLWLCFDNWKSKIQNKKWVGIFVILLTFVLSGVEVTAQQATKILRIGYLSPYGGPEIRSQAFQQGLHELGYIEGKNLVIEKRFANANPKLVAKFAKELVDLRVDVIFTNTTR
jgi:hypothetical protein